MPVFIIVLLLLMSVPIFAETISTASVDIDGEVYYVNEPLLIDGRTYVPYDNYLNTLLQKKNINFEITINTEYNYITANDRYLYYGDKQLYINDVLYIPLRTVSKIFNASVEWDSTQLKVNVTTGSDFIESGETFYNYDDVYWLSRIIYAESGAEDFVGKLAVGTVVMNRLASDDFPDSIYEVIFDTEYGLQFTPTKNNRIYNTPDEESIIAAKICLDGYKTDSNILYFLDESIATSKWIVNNRTYILTIGNHDFYS